MFSVPGWSVSTVELKAQTQQVSNDQKQTRNQTRDQHENTAEPTQKGSKRKRGEGRNASGEKVTRSNLDEMWRKHIERESSTAKGKSSTGKEQKERKKQKKGKDNGEHEYDNAMKNGGLMEEGGPPQPVVSNSSPAKTSKAGMVQKKGKQKDQKNKQPDNGSLTDTTATTVANNLPPPPASTSAALTPLQISMRQKLVSARFRHLNETLYTTPSTSAMELFSANPDLFNEYHAGFSHQVKESWPSNPVDEYTRLVKERGAIKLNHKGQPLHGKRNSSRSQRLEPLPRRPHGTCTIADLGCGDAQFAHALTSSSSSKSLNLKLLNFDLHTSDPLITKADISNLPVDDGSVDVAVFCLSLMGTNWISFVEEAWRVLRGDGKGECWVSEVKSRFGKVERKKDADGSAASGKNDKKKKKKPRKNVDDESDEGLGEEIFAEDTRASAAGGEETDISAFVEVFRSRGFVLKRESVDKSNKMFVKMEFVKSRGSPPMRGKYATADINPPRTGKFGGKKFLDHDSGRALTVEEESRVLKPCVYKTR